MRACVIWWRRSRERVRDGPANRAYLVSRGWELGIVMRDGVMCG